MPYVATKTGAWAGVEVDADPSYWSAQLRSTVRFEDALRVLARARDPDGKDELVLVEVGPGRTLTTFADQTSRTIERTWHTLATLPTADERGRGHER